MRVTTARLLLRKFDRCDKEDLYEIVSDEQTCLDDGGFHAFTEPDEAFEQLCERFLTQNRYAIVLRETGRMIGMIHVQDSERTAGACELGFVMNPQYRRRGYAYEAVHGLIDQYFAQTDVERFEVSHFPHNTASRRLIEKLGFTYEETRHEALNHAERGPVDLVYYRLEKSMPGK